MIIGAGLNKTGTMNVAVAVGTDLMVAAFCVAVSASNTFILPTHQENVLIMRPGGYRTRDYMRTELGMTVLYTGTDVVREVSFNTGFI